MQTLHRVSEWIEFCLVMVFNPLALIEAIFPLVIESNGRYKKCVGQVCIYVLKEGVHLEVKYVFH
jgi:hypothetical protein